MRKRCDRQGIERFLQSLGRRFTRPGRLYLVGGTTMVYTALSKIEWGTESDFDDVLSLLRSGRIELAVLTRYFEEIMVRYAVESIKQDPVEYRRKFEILTDMWLPRSFPG